MFSVGFSLVNIIDIRVKKFFSFFSEPQQIDIFKFCSKKIPIQQWENLNREDKVMSLSGTIVSTLILLTITIIMNYNQWVPDLNETHITLINNSGQSGYFTNSFSSSFFQCFFLISSVPFSYSSYFFLYDSQCFTLPNFSVVSFCFSLYF